MVEERAGCHRGIIKDQAEEVEETAKRFKTLKWTREAGTVQGYGSVVPGLILGGRKSNYGSAVPGPDIGAKSTINTGR
jgi:hypothetical protein